MAVKTHGNVGYGLTNSLDNLAPNPIIALRSPTTSDSAPLGTLWVDESTATVYCLASSSSGVNTWTTSAGSGVGIFTSLSVTPGNADIALGDLTVDAGNFEVTLGTSTLGGAVTLGSTLTVTGTSTFNGDIVVNGDFDLISSDKITIESTNNGAQAVYLHTDGGTSETLEITSSQGTGAGAVNINATVGGVTIAGGLATADAINISTTNAGGGIDIDAGTAGIAVDSTGAFSIDGAAASNVTTTGAGIDLTLSSVLGSVLVRSTEDAALAIRLHANGGTSETIQLHSDLGTGVGSINLLSDVGGLTFRATGLASADAINLEAVAGGIDVDAALQINIASSQASATAIAFTTSDVAGGVDMLAGTGGISIATTGALSLDSALASNLTVTGAGQDLTLAAVGGSVLVESTENAALAIRLHANGGTSETIQLHSDQGTGVGSVNLLSDVGGLTFRATGLASADAINLEAVAGGIDADAALQINVASSQAAATALRFVASDAAGGIDIDCGTGGIAVDSTGAFSIDGAAASNVTVTGAGINLTLSSVGGAVNVVSTEAAGDAVLISASDAIGGITLDSSAAQGCTFTNGTQVFQMMVGTGSPNGSLAAAQGSLFVNVAGNSGTTVLYCNTNGSTAWSVVGV